MSSHSAPVEPLIAVVPYPGAGPDVFTNANPPWTPASGIRSIFGGFLVGQAVSAAQATSPPGTSFIAHSLQCSFLRPGNARLPIVYRVDRAADGRTFATRVVHALQGNAELFVVLVSLQEGRAATRESPLRSVHLHGEAMPAFGRDRDPESISKDGTMAMLSQIGYTKDKQDSMPQDPFDWRFLALPRRETLYEDASTVRMHGFVRSPRLGSDEPAVHIAALAFLTDEWQLATPSVARPELVGEGSRDLKLQTTMNHSVVFHDLGARADAWMVSERWTSWAEGGRVLVHERLWNRETGRLVLSCQQEALVRIRGPRL